MTIITFVKEITMYQLERPSNAEKACFLNIAAMSAEEVWSTSEKWSDG